MLRCIFTFTLLFYSVGIYAQERPKILITYFSQSGNTQQMAEAVARGANSVDSVEVLLLAIEDVKVEDLLQAKGIILGSPVYNGNPAPPVLEFINSWPFEGRPLKDKIGAAFSTGGGISIGEEGVMLSILKSMLIHGLLVMGGEEVEAAFGASAITDEGPFQMDSLDPIFLKKAENLGKRVANRVLSFQ